MAPTATETAIPADVTEKTFTGYNAAQAETYNQMRRNYHSSVYEFILDHHKKTGGKFDTIVDIGCGPGMVTRSLAPHFTQAVGIDPSPALLNVAKTHPASPSNTEYHSSSASSFSPSPIPAGSASLITTANAAHWFPSMSTFYRVASSALQPGGTLAIWTTGHIRTASDLPNAAAIQAAIDHVIDVELEPYRTEATQKVRHGYRDLGLPWDDNDAGSANEFDKASFVRRDWTVDEKFLELKPIEQQGIPTTMLAKMLSTGSHYTRWREANPELADTEEDVMQKLSVKVGQLLRDAGVKPGEERVRGAACGVVLLFKKKA